MTAAAAAADGDTYIPHPHCINGGGGDVATAVIIMKTLVRDLLRTVPSSGGGGGYCIPRPFEGTTSYGYAKCWWPSMVYCQECLRLIGLSLVGSCNSTGFGHVWGAQDGCVLSVRFDQCPTIT
ncbi:unnamed protein product [Linum trigynum]|uniref:Uncharacterized protein n=1 Tax=Linum trigynum TaxID=586398 RepID=A0AAV2C9L9_9ROSI